MGYYSKVSIICGKKVFDEIMSLSCRVGIPDRCIFYREDLDEYRILLPEEKWYEDEFPEVKNVMAVVRKYGDMFAGEHEEGVSFARIGENAGDVETICNDILEIKQEVECRIWTSHWFGKIWKKEGDYKK